MKIKKIAIYFRFLDFLMAPLMWILCGFAFEMPQETHRWHMRIFPHIDVPKNKSIVIKGDDKSKHSTRGLPLYHMPLFGGWKNYVILKANNYGKYWNVGWIVEFHDSRNTIYQVQGSRIKSPPIKVLKGINDSDKTFFAVKENGDFADIRLIDSGRIGDGKYRKVRLF